MILFEILSTFIASTGRALISSNLIQIITYIIGAVWAFMLSFSSYPKESGVPIGLKFIMAIVASLWSWIYVVYYIFMVYIIGSEP